MIEFCSNFDGKQKLFVVFTICQFEFKKIIEIKPMKISVIIFNISFILYFNLDKLSDIISSYSIIKKKCLVFVQKKLNLSKLFWTSKLDKNF